MDQNVLQMESFANYDIHGQSKNTDCVSGDAEMTKYAITLKRKNGGFKAHGIFRDLSLLDTYFV
jgi:hypothetical protein